MAELERALKYSTQAGAIESLQAVHRGNVARKEVNVNGSAEAEKVLTFAAMLYILLHMIAMLGTCLT